MNTQMIGKNSYNDMNKDLRKKAKNDFKKDFLLNLMKIL